MKQDNMSRKYLLPTAYFPPLTWMAMMLNSDEALLEIHETFPKQTIRNRCRILSANGILRLSVPVQKCNGNQSKTSEIEVLYNENWQQNHFRSIESAYNKSPFYYHYRHHIDGFYAKRYELLTELNHASIQLVLTMLKSEKRFSYTTNWLKDSGDYTDLRNKLSDKNRIFHLTPYYQVFSDRHQFQPDLSILDLLFNEGPEALHYLKKAAAAYSG